MSVSLSHVPKRFLAIGCGSIGKRHISNLLMLHAGEILRFDLQEDHFTLNVLWGQAP